MSAHECEPHERREDAWRAFVGAVAAMRRAQVAYFRSRAQSDLRAAKDAERKVDAMLARDVVQPPATPAPASTSAHARLEPLPESIARDLGFS